VRRPLHANLDMRHKTGRRILRKACMEPIESRSDTRHKIIPARPSEVFAAMSDPARVARWWGPAGFTNTMHKFEFAAWRQLAPDDARA
jgi:hypothetical protein